MSSGEDKQFEWASAIVVALFVGLACAIPCALFGGMVTSLYLERVLGDWAMATGLVLGGLFPFCFGLVKLWPKKRR